MACRTYPILHPPLASRVQVQFQNNTWHRLMDQQTQDRNSTAEQYRTWLATTTNLSPITIKNYYFIVRKLLDNNSAPGLEDINTFLTQHTTRKSNGIMARAAVLKYLRWKHKENIPQYLVDKERLLPMRDVGRMHLPSDITLDKLKLIAATFPSGVHNDVFLMQFYSGCREIEAWLVETANVRITSIDVQVLITQKGGRTRVIHLPLLPFKAIFSKLEYQGKKYVFLKNKYQGCTRNEILQNYYGAITKAYSLSWQKACELAGLRRYASHDARRAIIRAVNDKYGTKAAQKVAGHIHESTTMKYLPDSEINALETIRDVMRE